MCLEKSEKIWLPDTCWILLFIHRIHSPPPERRYPPIPSSQILSLGGGENFYVRSKCGYFGKPFFHSHTDPIISLLDCFPSAYSPNLWIMFTSLRIKIKMVVSQQDLMLSGSSMTHLTSSATRQLPVQYLFLGVLSTRVILSGFLECSSPSGATSNWNIDIDVFGTSAVASLRRLKR